MVAAIGFEPMTCRVWTGRYNQLSYAAITLFACLPCGATSAPHNKVWLQDRFASSRKPFSHMVAGEGLEPTTSGLWARRATNCSTPRYWMLAYDMINQRNCQADWKNKFFEREIVPFLRLYTQNIGFCGKIRAVRKIFLWKCEIFFIFCWRIALHNV